MDLAASTIGMDSSKNIQMTGKDKFAIFHEIDGEYQRFEKEEDRN